MQKLALKHSYRFETDVTADPGVLEDPLHPMHQALLDRWTAPGDLQEQKFSPRMRLAVAMGGAASAWILVIGAGYGLASLM